MPHAGIRWAYDQPPAYAKMMVGEYTRINLKGDISFSTARENELCQLLGDLYPQFLPYFDKNGRNVKGLGYTLTHRASVCIKPEAGKTPEIARFEEPQWQGHLGLIHNALKKQKRIHDDDVMEATERSLMIQFDGVPGCYFRNNPNTPNYIYVGKAKDIAHRHHTSSALFLAQVIATATEQAAFILERILHGMVVDLGGEPVRAGSKGMFRFPNQVNALEKINDHMRKSMMAQQLLRSRLIPKKEIVRATQLSQV